MISLKTLSIRLTAALLALALTGLGFGHQHAPGAPADPLLTAYLEQGGSLHDLCLYEHSAPDGEEPADCPVCTLANGMALATVGSQAGNGFGIVMRNLPKAGHLLAEPHTKRAPPARGPPFALV